MKHLPRFFVPLSMLAVAAGCNTAATSSRESSSVRSQALSAAGSEVCTSINADALDRVVANASSVIYGARIALQSSGATQSAIDGLSTTSDRINLAAKTLRDAQLDASNVSMAYSLDWTMFDATNAVQAAVVALIAAPQPSDASRAAIDALSKLAVQLNDLGAQAGRCGIDPYVSTPAPTVPSPGPAPTSCNALDAAAMAPLSDLVAFAQAKAKADLASNTTDEVSYSQYDVDATNAAKSAVDAAIAVVQSKGAAALSPEAVVAFANAMTTVLSQLEASSWWASITAADVPSVDARAAFEAAKRGAELAVQLTNTAAHCSFPAPVMVDPAPPPVTVHKERGANDIFASHATDASGFPYVATDTFAAWGDLKKQLRDAGSKLEGAYPLQPAAGSPSTGVESFISAVESGTPTHRLGQLGARLVRVYSDAPVYIVGGFALLPGANGKAVDLGQFKLDGSDFAALDAFCTANASQCVPLSREHVQNRSTAAILIAARSVIVRGHNETHGMSVVTLAENILMPRGGDNLNLAVNQAAPARGAAAAPIYRHLPMDSPELTTGTEDILTGTPQPPPSDADPSAEISEDTAHADLYWAWKRSKDESPGEPATMDARRGLAGLGGGSWLAFAYRTNDLTAVTVAQHGGDGLDGVSVTVACADDWKFDSREINSSTACVVCDETPRTIGVNGSVCVPSTGTPQVGYQNCDDICKYIPGPSADGAMGGPAGTPGVIAVYAVAKTDRCGSQIDLDLADLGPTSPQTLGDRTLGLDATCSDGLANDGSATGAIDCAAPACSDDPNVTVCGLHEPAALEIPHLPPASAKSKGLTPAAASARAKAVAPKMAPSFLVPIGTEPFQLCMDEKSTNLEVSTNMPGSPGKGGEPAGQWCRSQRYPNGTSDTNTPGTDFAVHCESKIIGVDAAARSGAQVSHSVGIAPLTPSSWARAVYDLHPLETKRRIAVGRRRFEQNQRGVAEARLLEVKTMLDADQQWKPGSLTDFNGKLAFQCTDPGLDLRQKDICGLRAEVETYLTRIANGQNVYGYSPAWVPPHVMVQSDLFAAASYYLQSARSEMATWETNTRIAALSQQMSAGRASDLANQLLALDGEIKGSLTNAITAAQNDKQIATDDIRHLQEKVLNLSASVGALHYQGAVKTQAYTQIAEALVVVAVSVLFFEVGPEVAPLISEALGGMISAAVIEDLMQKAIEAGIGDKLWNVEGYLTREDAMQDAAKKGLEFLVDHYKDYIPSAQVQKLASATHSDTTISLKDLQLQDERIADLIELQDASERFTRSVEDLVIATAKKTEAAGRLARMQREEATIADHSSTTAQLDALLAVHFESAQSSLELAGEMTFLAKRAFERDFVTYTVAADGTQTNTLNAALRSDVGPCTGQPADTIGVSMSDAASFVNASDAAPGDCLSWRIWQLRFATRSAESATFKDHGRVDVVVPIDPSMRHVADSGAVTYVVPIDVTVDMAHASNSLFAGARAHRFDDVTVAIDDARTGYGAVRMTRDEGNRYWLGPTAAGPGDLAQFLSLDASPVALQGLSGALLQGALTASGWTPSPQIGFAACHGPASDNALLSSSSPVPCHLAYRASSPTANDGVVIPAYVGRSLLGSYVFELGEEDVTPGASLRAIFEYSAQDD